MLDLPALDVALGLILLYVVLSVISSTINESIAGLFRWRSKDLVRGLQNLLSGTEKIDPEGTTLADRLLEHPLIQALAPARKGNGHPSAPAYIPSRTFVTALLTMQLGPPETASADTPYPKTGAELRTTLGQIQHAPLQRALLALLDEASDDVVEFRKSVETWFDDSMDRVSGWYRRKTQKWLVLWAVLIVVPLNADTVQFVDRLWKDEAVRSAVVERAEKVGRGGEEELDIDDALNTMNLPVGWTLAFGDDARDLPNDTEAWLAKVFGLALTVVALLFGAPFWFDLLGKVARLRVAGIPPKKAKEPETQVFVTTGQTEGPPAQPSEPSSQD